MRQPQVVNMKGQDYLVPCLLRGDYQDDISQIWRPKVRHCRVIFTRSAEMMLDPLSSMINGIRQLGI